MEDTDQKRQIDGVAALIVSGLQKFGISIDEGPMGENNVDVGVYGPYTQSERKYLYEVFVKEMIASGNAYPCWMKEEEISVLRDQQTKSKVIPGIYGNYSFWRNKSPEEIVKKIIQ
jgi:glutamyl-tRNA synthetase